MKVSCYRMSVFAGLALAIPAVSQAADWWGNAPTDRLTIAARDSEGHKKTIRVNLDNAATGPTGEQSVDLMWRGELLGRVSYQLGADPHSLPLNFTAVAGDLDTEFFISVPNRVFAAVNDAEGRADANVTVTDLNGDGASSMGMFGDQDFYRWDYNGTVPNGTLFSTQVSGPLDAAPNGFNTGGSITPVGSGFTPLGAPVSILSGRVHFTLSAFDRAEGTGLFQINALPTPGAFTLAGTSILCILRRRRS